METNVPVSVIVLTKNESTRIRDCIKSVRWAGEVLVIDDESSDDTVAIAESLGARVLQRKMDNEGRHRNWASRQAQFEWVLSLDADERVTPELAEEITQLFQRGTTPPYETYAIPRRNYLGSRWLRHGGWYPSAQLKLFKRSVFRWEETWVHPRAFSDRPCSSLQHDLIHYSYRDLSDFVAKLNRQTTLEAQKWVTDGRRMTLPKALWRSGDRFVRAYLSKQGYRDGVYGYLVAILGVMYQFLSYAKYWEERRRSHTIDRNVTFPREVVMSVTTPRVTPVHQQLTILLLTKNESEKLRECLESVRWADEIVMVDGQSTDGTQAIGRAYNAHVIERPFSGSFSEERNAGLEVATGDWILQMDADDTVSPELRSAIERLLCTDSPHAAFKIRRRNYFLGHKMRYGGWYHYNTVLFRRECCRYEGLVHERLIVKGSVGLLSGDLCHRPFDAITQFVDRQNRYTTLQAQELQQSKQVYPEQQIVRQVHWRPFKIFWKLYLKKQGFREGMHGFLFSVLFAWVDFLKWAKYWELERGDRSTDGRMVTPQVAPQPGHVQG